MVSTEQALAGVLITIAIIAVVWRTIHEHRRRPRRVWQTDIQTPPAHPNCRCTLAPVDLEPDIGPTIRRVRRQLAEADGIVDPDERRRYLQFWTGGRILRRHIERSHELTEHDIAEAKAGRIPQRFYRPDLMPPRLRAELGIDAAGAYVPDYPRNLEAMRAYAADIDRQMLEGLNDDERAELGLEPDVDACLEELERLAGDE